MKRTLLYSVSAAALFVAAPAFAQSYNNVSNVSQNGDTEAAMVNQIGSNDTSNITQDNATGHNTATVNQNGKIGGQSDITQKGDHNTATLNQSDDGSAYIGGPATDGSSYPAGAKPISVSSINQGGNGNSADVTQATATNAATNNSAVDQSGDGNSATVKQYDDAQYSSVSQSSAGNTASVTQGLNNGADNSWHNASTLVQSGGGSNAATVTQTGTDGVSSVYQTGSNGAANVTQGGSFATSYVGQSGDTDNATVTQHDGGSMLTSSVDQQAANNTAVVDQSGSNSQSYVTQLGATNAARVARFCRELGS